MEARFRPSHVIGPAGPLIGFDTWTDPPAARPVSQGELYGLKAQVRRLKANDARRDVEDAVARGEIRPGDREKMLRLAGWNPKLFRERLAEGRRAPAALVDRYAPRAGRIHPRDPKRAHALALAMAAKAATMKAKR